MAQFDVFENIHPETKKEIPFLLDVQADLLGDLATHVVVPLVLATIMKSPAKHLNPEFIINKTRVVMSTAELAGVPVRIFGNKVHSLADSRGEIISALDFLFTGF